MKNVVKMELEKYERLLMRHEKVLQDAKELNRKYIHYMKALVELISKEFEYDLSNIEEFNADDYHYRRILKMLDTIGLSLKEKEEVLIDLKYEELARRKPIDEEERKEEHAE